MQKKTWIRWLCCILIIAAMAGAAELLQEKEIIFPEIAAIAAGALCAPSFAWKTSLPRMLVWIMICAFTGVGIVLFVPLPITGQMCLAFLVAQLFFIHSGTTFAPMISAAVLPVLLQTSSAVYLVSAFVLTSGILLVRRLLEKAGYLESVPFDPVSSPDRRIYLNAGLRTLAGWILIAAALRLSIKFAVAPPLLVAFTELWNPDSAGRRHPVRLAGLITISACIGVLTRMLLYLHFSVPAFFGAALTMLLVLLFMKRLKLYAPPAAAIAILAYLIPAAVLPGFPLQILPGIVSMIIVALFCPKIS